MPRGGCCKIHFKCPLLSFLSVWSGGGDHEPSCGPGGRRRHVLCRSQETHWRQHHSPRFHHSVALPYFLPANLKLSFRLSFFSCSLYLFIDCTCARAAARQGSARFTILPAFRKPRPCSPSSRTEWVTQRTSLLLSSSSFFQVGRRIFFFFLSFYFHRMFSRLSQSFSSLAQILFSSCVFVPRLCIFFLRKGNR